MLTPETMDRAWACVAANVVKNAADRFEQFMKEGKDKEEALEMCSQERFVAAKVHTAGYIYRQFKEGIAELAKKEDKSNGVIETLEKVCTLYGAWSMEENASYFLKYKFYTPEQMDLVTAAVSLFDRTKRMARAHAGTLSTGHRSLP